MSTAAKKKKPQIHTLKSLRRHLQWALEVEHFTIPPYLCALWSLKEGHNPESYEVIKSVVMEEMLHMTLVANLMNAVEAPLVIDKPGFIPTYPNQLPHICAGFEVHLTKFSKKSVETFMKIEKPEKVGDPPEADCFHTIGQFYDAVAEGLEYLVEKHGEKSIFTGDPRNQVAPKHYYGGGGFVFKIEKLQDARHAIREIAEQGEGSLPEGDELGSVFDGDQYFGQPPEPAHFYRFQELKLGRKYQINDQPYDPKEPKKTGPTGAKFKVNWDEVYNMQKKPQAGNYPIDSPIRLKMDKFNRIYTNMLQIIEKAYTGQPHLLQEAVGIMYKLKYLGKELMRIPTGKGNTTVGPSFEYHP